MFSVIRIVEGLLTLEKIIVSAMVLLTGFLLLDFPDEYDAAIDDEFSVDGLEYSVLSEVGFTERLCLLGGGDDPSIVELNVPGSVEFNGIVYKVIAIGDDAFSGDENLISITISENVKSIGVYAFAGCSSVESLVLPESLESIRMMAFNGTSISEITVPSNVSEIGLAAFSMNSSMTSLVVDADNTSINHRGRTP